MPAGSSSYIVPLKEVFVKCSRGQRAKKAIAFLKKFIRKHKRVDLESISLSQELNESIWSRGIHNIPRRLEIELLEEEGKVIAFLKGEKELKEWEKAKKEKKKAEEEKAKEKAEKEKAEKEKNKDEKEGKGEEKEEKEKERLKKEGEIEEDKERKRMEKKEKEKGFEIESRMRKTQRHETSR
ncbi:MAG: 50S ribosomal protein L31e [Candidatus Diapherotrites archaeon]